MSFRKRVLVILLSLIMVMTYIPAFAFAASDVEEVTEPAQTEETVDEEKTDEVIVTGTDLSYSVNVKPEVELADNDELLMQYLQKEVSSEVQAPKPGMLKASRATRGSRLSPNSKLIYNELVPYVTSIAEGKCSTTDNFVFPVNNLDFDHEKWYTASDLGADSIYAEDENGNTFISTDAYYGILKVLGYEAEPNSDKVVNALIADLPYEMYWYDKLAGTDVTVVNITEGTLKDNGEPVLNLNNANLTFKFTVAGGEANTGYPEYGYRSDENNAYSINAAKVQKANDAAEIAGDIINSHQEADVYDRLDAYREEILARNTYNDAAAASPSEVYGDPWQMIYVFDRDPDTNAVCEGYAKAFQFLIDNTAMLASKGVECYSILGNMIVPGHHINAAHMWNIVTMDDGRNYLADLTNCDAGTIGSPDKLFLRGCMAGGTVANGYDFDLDADKQSDIRFKYSKQALSLYDEELVLCEEDYKDSSRKPVYNWSDDNKTVTAEAYNPDDPENKFTETVNTTSEVTAQPTCTEGTKVTYTAVFTNPLFTKQTKTVTGDDTIDHKLQKVALRKATAASAGNIEHWKCSVCGKLFSDQEGKNEIPQAQTVIPKAAAPAGKVNILNTIANSSRKTNDVIWDKSKVTGATGYIIEWRARGVTNWASRRVGNVTRGVTSGLTIGNLYEIRVTPYKAATAATAEVKGTPSAIVYRYFFTTQKIRLASNSKGTFTMSWARDSKATSYQVLYTTNKNGSGAAQNIKTAGKTATSITVRDIKVNGKVQKLQSGKTYYVQIREVRTVGGKNYIGNISCPVAVKVR